ncbi:MAG: hypothetical protein GX444_03935 [Myxococcales bacterium]|nr:hypothetical protein [Myxococcales bacterium]
MISQSSKMEWAKALKGVRDISTPEQFQKVVEALGIQNEAKEIQTSILGLSEEDEFALMCLLMGTTTHLIRLEQRHYIPGKYIAPDFFARFKPGYYAQGFTSDDFDEYKCLVEVKTTDKTQYDIGRSYLNRYRAVADIIGVPLLFAVRFTRFRDGAVWVIHEDNDRSQTNLKIRINDMIGGLRTVLWDECNFLLRPGLTFRAIYDRDSQDKGIFVRDFGPQVDFQCCVDGQFQSFPKENAWRYSVFFEAFDLAEDKVEQQGSITYQELVPHIQSRSIADIIYSCNNLPTDEKGRKTYDASKIVVRIEEELDPAVISKPRVIAVAQKLMEDKLIFLGHFGEPEKHLEKWRRIGGKK